MRVLKHLPTVVLVCVLGALVVFALLGFRSNWCIMKANAAEDDSSDGVTFPIREDDSSVWVIAGPKAGDPWMSIQIEARTGAVVLVKGVYETPIMPGDPTEVMRLTHDGFVVVGKCKIHIDVLVAVIEELANEGRQTSRTFGRIAIICSLLAVGSVFMAILVITTVRRGRRIDTFHQRQREQMDAEMQASLDAEEKRNEREGNLTGNE